VYSELFEERPEEPKALIDGLLHVESKMIIAAQSKLGKTWLAMDLGLSLIEGNIWMGFDTCQSRLLYLNMEMSEAWFDIRLYELQQARGMKTIPKDALNVLHLRGAKASKVLKDNLGPLIQRCKEEGPFDVIVIDPLYKLFGKRKENAAEDVADLFAEVDELIDTSKSSVIMVHHFAKGDAWMKEMGDRASGSGVFYRDPDVFMTLTRIKPQSEFDINVLAKVEISGRNIRERSAFGIRREDYQWKRDANIAIKKSENKQPTQADKLLTILKDNPQGLTYTQWKDLAMTRFNIGRDSFNVAKRGIIKKIKLEGNLYKVELV
jgi:RecA-family ATPase